MPVLRWSDCDEIGFQLSRKFPDIDPLTIRFEELRRWVMELPEFDDPGESNEGVLEAIQMAWLEYYRQTR